MFHFQPKNMTSVDKCDASPFKTTVETPITAFVNAIFQQDLVQQKKLPLTFLQLTQTILDEIIAFHSYVQSTNSVNFSEIDKNTFAIKIDDPNFYIAKCILQQAILLNATQIPVLIILVQSEQDRQRTCSNQHLYL